MGLRRRSGVEEAEGPVIYERPPVFDRTPDDFVTVADIEAGEKRLSAAIRAGAETYELVRVSTLHSVAAIERYRPTAADPPRTRADIVAAVERVQASADRQRAMADAAIADAEDELAALKAAWLGTDRGSR